MSAPTCTLTESIADAAYWKGEARKAQADKSNLLAALENLASAFATVQRDCMDWKQYNEANRAIAKAKGHV